MAQKNQVEFKAGKMDFDPATKMVNPDKRLGRIKVSINAEEEIHFEWYEGSSNTPEIDLIVFRDDAKFTKIKKAAGRIFKLEFQSYDDKYFFWMQEKEEKNDQDYADKVNKIINTAAMEEEPKPVQNTAQNQPARGTNPNPTQSNRAMELSNMFSQALSQAAAQGGRRQTPYLSEIFNHKFNDSIINDPDYFNALKEHLPESQQTEEGFKENLRSPQLTQALDSLDEALNSEEGQSVLLALGFDPKLWETSKDGVEALIKALLKEAEEAKKK